MIALFLFMDFLRASEMPKYVYLGITFRHWSFYMFFMLENNLLIDILIIANNIHQIILKNR